MQSRAATVAEYLASLPEDRRAALSAVREVILKNLDEDYREGMQYGMIGYYVPHEVFGPGYHCDPRQPLPFGGLASQKQHMSLYLMCTYGESPIKAWFTKAWKATGKKLDMGKACIRFKRLEEVPLEVVGELVRRVPAKKWVEIYGESMASMGKGVDGKALKKGGGGRAEGGRKSAGSKSSRGPSGSRTRKVGGKGGAKASRGGKKR